MTLAHGVPLVRPDDVLTGLARVWPAFAPREVPVLTRLTPGTLDAGDRIVVELGRLTWYACDVWDTGCGSGATCVRPR